MAAAEPAETHRSSPPARPEVEEALPYSAPLEGRRLKRAMRLR